MDDEVKEPTTPEELAYAALIAEAEADAIKKIIADAEAEIKAADAEMERVRAEMQAQLNLMAQKKQDLRAAIWDTQREYRKKQQQAESYLRQKEQAERAALAQAEWATLEQRWDQLTMRAPWREWAKDHQIDGAKKITYEGRMILGDTMGLGKTLTSLIAIDMIQAATKDASPSNPVEFGSMK